MPGRKLALFALACTIVCHLGSGPARAGTKMVIKPSVAAGTGYETNYLSSDTDERPVYYYYLEPGLEFGLTTAKSSLLFDYTLTAYKYEEKDDPPPGELDISSYDYVGHDMALTAETQATDRLKLELSDSFILTRDPDELDPYANEIIKLKYASNEFSPKLEYRLSDTFTLGAGYSYSTIDYDRSDQEDSRENRGAANLVYHLNSITSLDLKFEYWQVEYDKTTPDYDSRQTTLTFLRELKYYTISLGAGYQTRSFESDLASDISGPVWNIRFKCPRPYIMVSLGQNYNDTAVADQYYLATRLSAEFGSRFWEKIDLKIKGYFQNSDFEDSPENREDDTWSLSCSADYDRNEYLSFGIEAGYRMRDSNIHRNDFENAFVAVNIIWNYNLGSR